MGYGDPANFVNRKPLPPDLQHQLYALNLVTHNFGVKAMHAVYAAELSDREPPSTSSAEHDDPDESY
ncbi:hypothetical protein M3Y98_00484700 [Aphelenchoides besseyi]|nr:hypothetical protein M3Y98_00484700 [Aphelenchoides besseyi]